jgi:hypothetical protein
LGTSIPGTGHKIIGKTAPQFWGHSNWLSQILLPHALGESATSQSSQGSRICPGNLIFAFTLHNMIAITYFPSDRFSLVSAWVYIFCKIPDTLPHILLNFSLKTKKQEDSYISR